MKDIARRAREGKPIQALVSCRSGETLPFIVAKTISLASVKNRDGSERRAF